MRRLRQSRTKAKTIVKTIVIRSSFFSYSSFCLPLSFPKTRKKIPLLGLAYERQVSGALYKTLYETNKNNNFQPGLNPHANHPHTNHFSLPNHFSHTNHLLNPTNHFPFPNHLSDTSGNFPLSPNHLSSLSRFYFSFCHNPWLEYKLSSETFQRHCSPDFLIFVSLIPADYDISFLLENFIQIPNEKLPLAANHLLLNPSGNFLFKNLLAIITLEVKLTYTPYAHQTLSGLYSPLVSLATNHLSIPRGNFFHSVICKNLTPSAPAFVSDSIFSSFSYAFPLVLWLGNAKLKI